MAAVRARAMMRRFREVISREPGTIESLAYSLGK
jgi:hypothetical protein